MFPILNDSENLKGKRVNGNIHVYMKYFSSVQLLLNWLHRLWLGISKSSICLFCFGFNDENNRQLLLDCDQLVINWIWKKRMY